LILVSKNIFYYFTCLNNWMGRRSRKFRNLGERSFQRWCAVWYMDRIVNTGWVICWGRTRVRKEDDWVEWGSWMVKHAGRYFDWEYFNVW